MDVSRWLVFLKSCQDAQQNSRAVLRGTPRWHPDGSHWYQPLPYGPHEPGQWETPGPLFEQNTMLLLADSMDRSGGVGFRCVAEE